MTKIRAHSGCEAEDGYHLTMTFVLPDPRAAAQFLVEMLDALGDQRVPVSSPPRYAVRDVATREVVSVQPDLDAALGRCEPGHEVVDASTASVVWTEKSPTTPSKLAVNAAASRTESEPPAAPKPGMDPAAVLDYYDQQSRAAATQTAGSTSTYATGGRYDGVEIVKVQTGIKQGFGVLTLADGTKIKYDLRTGHTLEVKNAPPSPASAAPGDLTVAPTTRQGGAGAPRVDEPAADVNGTPIGQTPEWMAPIAAAPSLKDAVRLAIARVGRGDVREWALRMAEQVPTIRRVDAATRGERIDRVLALIDAESA